MLSSNFPKKIKRIRYIQNDNGTKLRFDPTHSSGLINDVLDLRFYSNIKTILQTILQDVDYRFCEVNLSENPECDEEIIRLLGKEIPRLSTCFRRLILNQCQHLPTAGLQIIARQFVTLTHLVISNNVTQVDNRLILTICDHLPHLTYIDISGCSNLTDESIVYLANTYAGQLISFRCARNPLLTTQASNEIMMKCDQLIELDFSFCHLITFVGVVVNVRDKVIQYITRKLKRLSMNYCINLDYYSLCWISTALPDLEEVYLQGIKLIDAHILQSIVGSCPLLKALVVTKTTPLPDNTCLHYFSHQRLPSQLVSLTLSNLQFPVNIDLSNEILLLLINNKHLQSLNLSGNSFINDKCFVDKTKPLVYSSTILSSLNLGFTNITSLGLIYVVRNFMKLQKLNINGCTMIDNLAIQAMVQCIPKSLEHLYMNGCHRLTDDAILLLCQYCKNLYTLHLSYDSLAIPWVDSSNGTRYYHASKTLSYTQSCSTWITQEGYDLDISFNPLHLSNTNQNILNIKYGGKQYSDVILFPIFFELTHIRDLNISHQWGIYFKPNPLLLRSNSLLSNYTLEILDLYGCESIQLNQLKYILMKCYALTNVYFPYGAIKSKHITSKQYWSLVFGHTLYTTSYDAQAITGQQNMIDNALKVTINTRKSIYSSNQSVVQQNGKLPDLLTLFQGSEKLFYQRIRSYYLGYPILQPHPYKYYQLYKTQYIQRQFLEEISISMIKKMYYRHIIWMKFRDRIMTRRIIKAYHNYKAYHKYLQTIEKFRLDYAANKIQRYCVEKLIKYHRARKIILRNYLIYRIKKQKRFLQKQLHNIIVIQRYVRGYLTRISMNYIISQIFLQLPPFWRTIASIDLVIGQPENYSTSIPRLITSPPKTPAMLLDGPKSTSSRASSTLKKLDQLMITSNSHVQSYEVRHLTKEVNHLLHQTESRLAHSLSIKKKLSKLPIIIPQTFDIQPYASITDGTKISYFSTTNSLFKDSFLDATAKTSKISEELQTFTGAKVTNLSPTKEKLPVHIYNTKYYPLVNPRLTSNKTSLTKDLDLFDRDINNFEYAESIKRQYLLCSLCSQRLQVIHCQTCSLGYCFYCAYQNHYTYVKHNHQLTFIEPRYPSSEQELPQPSNSLIFHSDQAKNIMHDLKYIVKYLRSVSEIQRIAKEKRLLKEYEEKQEALRIAQLQAQEIETTKHDNATKISLLFYQFKAKKIVREKRIQLKLEDLLNKYSKFLHSVIRIQVLFRRYRVRLWLYKRGFVFQGVSKYYSVIPDKLNPKKNLKSFKKSRKSTMNKGKILARQDLLDHVSSISQARAVYHRNQLFGKVEEKYAEVLQMLQANIDYWKKKFIYFNTLATKYNQLRDIYYNEHQEKARSLNLQNLSNTSLDKDRNEKYVKCLHLRYDSMQERLEIVRVIVYWITQHMRFLYRKKAILPIRYQDVQQQLVWIQCEFQLLQRLKGHVQQRHDEKHLYKQFLSEEIKIKFRKTYQKKKNTNLLSFGVSKTKDNGEELTPEIIRQMEETDSLKALRTGCDWIKPHLETVISLQMQLDSQQESVLKEEIVLIEYDYHDIQTFDALLEELVQSLYVNNQFIAERIAMDKQLVYLVYGSKEAISLNEQMITLKAKQRQLVTGTIDSLKLALQQKYDDYDTRTMQMYAFPNDSPDLPVLEMEKIQAVLLNSSSISTHIQVEDFLKIYFLQPWLGEESIQDIRYEERINGKEIRLGQLQEELQAKILFLQSNEQDKFKAEQEMRELRGKIEAHRDAGVEETAGQREARESSLVEFQKQLQMVSIQLDAAVRNLAEADTVTGPIEQEINDVMKEIEDVKEQLIQRRKSRQRAIMQFFEIEKNLCSYFSTRLIDILQTIEDQNMNLQEKYDQVSRAMEAYIPTGSQSEKEDEDEQEEKETKEDQVSLSPSNDEDTNSIEVVVPPFMINHPRFFELQAVQHQSKPRLYCQSKHHASMSLLVKERTFKGTIQYYEMIQQYLRQEQAFLSNYPQLMSKYQNFLRAYMDELQFHRRQRALALDLELRQQRLLATRKIRYQALMKLKEEQRREEEELRRKKEELAKTRKSVLKRAAQATKKQIRNVKDKIREMRYQNAVQMNEEELRMAKNIQEKNKEGLGSRPECIKYIHFTVGKDEVDFFQRQNDHLKSKALPYFARMDRSIGNQIFLWTQKTFDSSKFITDIVLAHKEEGNEYFKDLTANRYDSLESPSSVLRIWFRRDRKSKQGISDIKLSYTEEEETRLIVDGYMKIEPSLAAFDLPEVFIWVLKIDKQKEKKSTNTDAIIAEVLKVREMLETYPKNRNLIELLQRLNDKLKDAYQKELNSEVLNPLKVAVDLLALDEADMDKWIKVYEKLDKDRKGRILLEKIFEYLEVTPTPIVKEVFFSLDSVDEDGYVEFGDFIRTFATFCFFGKEEILRFAFVFVDKDHKGVIPFSKFVDLIETIHPYDKLRSKRALKGLSWAGYTPEKPIKFSEVQLINEQYPALLLPVFLLQNAMREKTLGDDWWFKKLQRYNQVRTKMSMEGENVDELVSVELQRFRDDEERKIRMAQREVEIKNEASEVRKTLLQAKQFLDEMS